MSKNVFMIAAFAVAAFSFSSRPVQVSAESQEWQRQALRHSADVRLTRYELIGVHPDKGDLHTLGTSIFVLDHDTGSVIRHSFGTGTQRGLVTVSTVDN